MAPGSKPRGGGAGQRVLDFDSSIRPPSGGLAASVSDVTPQGMSEKPKAAAAGKKKKKKKEGFRAFRIETTKEHREELKLLFEQIVSEIHGAQRELPRNLHRYDKVHQAIEAAARRNRKRAGKRTPPKEPPIFLLTCFIENGEVVYGNTGAPVRVHLDKGVLKLRGISIPLDGCIVRALREELRLTPPPRFVTILTRRGRIRLIALRSPPPALTLIEESADFFKPPYRIVGFDLNSRYGLALVVFDVDENFEVKMVDLARLQPPNAGYFHDLAKPFQKVAQKKYEKLTDEEIKIIEDFEKEIGKITPERARRMFRQLKRSAKIRREYWVRAVLCRVRRYIRGAPGGTVLVIDPPDPSSLQGTGWQNTVLSLVKRLRNLARYEGAILFIRRESGKYCPLCREPGVEVAHRYYQCDSCQLTWDRDYCAAYRCAAAFAPLRTWLQKHTRALAPNYFNQNTPPGSRATPNRGSR